MQHVFIAMVFLFSAAALFSQEKGEVVVRKIQVKLFQGYRKNIERSEKLMEQTREGVHVFLTREEAQKFLYPDLLSKIEKQINFGEEMLVAVRWNAKGPPFGVIDYKVVDEGTEGEGTDARGGKGKKSTIEFYLKTPNSKNRGRKEVTKRGLDFFAVPQSVEVKMKK